MSSRMRPRRCSMSANAAVCRRTLRSRVQALTPAPTTTSSTQADDEEEVANVQHGGSGDHRNTSKERNRILKGTSSPG